MLVAALGCAWWMEKSTRFLQLPPAPHYTGRELDLAIMGRGYFMVTNSDNQTLYTRHGRLALNASGDLCLAKPDDKWLIEPPIKAYHEAVAIEINNDGTILMRCSHSDRPGDVGQLQLATFINPDGLTEVSPGLYATSADSGGPCVSCPDQNGAGTIRQFWLEK